MEHLDNLILVLPYYTILHYITNACKDGKKNWVRVLGDRHCDDYFAGMSKTHHELIVVLNTRMQKYSESDALDMDLLYYKIALKDSYIINKLYMGSKGHDQAYAVSATHQGAFILAQIATEFKYDPSTIDVWVNTAASSYTHTFLVLIFISTNDQIFEIQVLFLFRV